MSHRGKEESSSRRFFHNPLRKEVDDQLPESLNSMEHLIENCLHHYFDIRDSLQEQNGLPPTRLQILHYLDDGHLAWAIYWFSIDKHPEWNRNKRLHEWIKWYQKWDPWFKENHPNYYVNEDIKK